jgi:hypothetical protein
MPPLYFTSEPEVGDLPERHMKVEDLQDGDYLDLEKDPIISAATKEEICADMEFFQVNHVEQETPGCVVIGYEGYDNVGYPTGTFLDVRRPAVELWEPDLTDGDKKFVIESVRSLQAQPYLADRLVELESKPGSVQAMIDAEIDDLCKRINGEGPVILSEFEVATVLLSLQETLILPENAADSDDEDEQILEELRRKIKNAPRLYMVPEIPDGEAAEAGQADVVSGVTPAEPSPTTPQEVPASTSRVRPRPR